MSLLQLQREKVCLKRSNASLKVSSDTITICSLSFIVNKMWVMINKKSLLMHFCLIFLLSAAIEGLEELKVSDSTGSNDDEEQCKVS